MQFASCVALMCCAFLPYAVSNFGYGWYTHTVTAVTQYKPYIAGEITAQVGIHVGLRGLNITLLGSPEYQFCITVPGQDANMFCERINYNEQFWWADPWAQGRIGFGRYAGRLNQEFRAAQYRGVPYPIQWVAEYFTLDGEQIRWGRKFRLAGWYAHQLLWLGFAIYLMTALFFLFSVRYGALGLAWIGAMMILANFWYGVIIINDPPLEFPFADSRGSRVLLAPSFGWSWYLVLVTGILSFFLGLVIFILNYFVPRKVAVVFNLEVAEEDDIFFQEAAEEGGAAGLDEYGVSTGSSTRRRGTVSRFRQTQRKTRKTQRSTRGQQSGSPGDIPLQEVS